MTAKDLMLAIINERQFMEQIRLVAAVRNWMVYHTHDSRRSQPGFPDLVLVRDRVLFRELKTEKGRLTADQLKWGEALVNAGADFAVWRPSQIEDIVKELE